MEKRAPLIKWEFNAVAAEELMRYFDEEEIFAVFSYISGGPREHALCPPKHNTEKKYLHYMICSMEESIVNKMLPTQKSKGSRKCAQRKRDLATCTNSN